MLHMAYISSVALVYIVCVHIGHFSISHSLNVIHKAEVRYVIVAGDSPAQRKVANVRANALSHCSLF